MKIINTIIKATALCIILLVFTSNTSNAQINWNTVKIDGPNRIYPAGQETYYLPQDNNATYKWSVQIGELKLISRNCRIHLIRYMF